MTFPPIFILGYSQAAMLLANPGPNRISALIAICGQREFAVDHKNIPHHLILHFDDIDACDESDPLQATRFRIRQRESAALGLTLKPPTIADAQQIIDFATSIRETDGALLCHCAAGVSRSAAVALLCLATWTGPGHELFCMQQLRRIRPCAMPHRDIVKFGDTLLHRNGRLLAALDPTSHAKIEPT